MKTIFQIYQWVKAQTSMLSGSFLPYLKISLFWQVSLKTFSFRYYYVLNSTTKSVWGKRHWKNSIPFHKSNKLQNQCYWSLLFIINVRMGVQQTHIHEFRSIIRPSYGWLASEKVMVSQEISTSLIICPCKTPVPGI